MSYYLYESEKQTFTSFVADCLNELFDFDDINEIKETDLNGIINSNFENILYINNSEVLFYPENKKTSTNKYYKFMVNTIPKNITINFGCELETCFLLNCNIKKDDKKIVIDGIDDRILSILPSIKKGDTWSNLIIYHLRTNIIPYLTLEFTKKFRFAYILPEYHSKKRIYLDLKNGKIVNNVTENEEYKTLIFEPDSSIKCNTLEDITDSDEITIPCEIVTPILSSLDDIKLLYNGLLSSMCNKSNKSMGFHVNVSAISETGKQVILTRGMLTELIYKWLPYEKKNYKKLRGEGSIYARKIKDILNDNYKLQMINLIIKNINGDKIDNDEYFEKYGLNSWLITDEISNEKHYSLTNHKKNNVIEFRVFPSDTNIDTLLQYTRDAIDVFESAIKKYIDNPQKTILKLQKTYCKYVYNTDDIVKNYSGYLDEWDILTRIRGDITFQYIFRIKQGIFESKYLIYPAELEDFIYTDFTKKELFNKIVFEYKDVENNTSTSYVYDFSFDFVNYTFSIKNPKKFIL